MKRQFLVLIFALIVCLAAGQNRADSLAVEKACRDYVEGWASGDAARVDKAVSPDLVKRTIGQDKDGNSYVNTMSASLLLMVTRMNKEGVKAKDLDPGKPFSLEVKICDLTGDFALVKTSNTKYGFFDYCQLAKYNHEWKIVNVLWGYLPKQPSSEK